MSESQYGNPLIVTDSQVHVLEKIPANQYDEAYIQDLAFDYPECLPINEIDRVFEGLIPVCKEFHTPVGPLDILYVTSKGRLVIVEAKLWCNPEARRKVIGQILDYAKEISRWNYQDLQREVSKATGRKGNVLFELVKEKHPEADEAEFVDEVTRTLTKGRFLLLILGDGIREGVAAIAEFLEETGQLEFTFGMLELVLYKTPSGNTLLQPRVLAKTVVFKRLVIAIDQAGASLLEDGDDSFPVQTNNVNTTELQKFYLEFWPEWLSELELDDPSQPFPKNKNPARGNIAFDMPASNSWITVYFYQNENEAGVFLTFYKGEFANQAYSYLLDNCDDIESELGIDIGWQSDGEKHKVIHKMKFNDLRSKENRQAIKDYFSDTVNRFVNVFRPRIQKLIDD